MATEKQIEANRRNSQKSTGPRTEEGRAAVRFNSLKHGMTAQSLCLPGDDPDQLEAFLASYEADFRPTTQAELDLVFQMAMAMWRTRRFRSIEAAFYAYEIKDHQYPLRDHPDLNEDGRIACILGHQDNNRTVANFARYMAEQERSYLRASKELSRIRKETKQSKSAEVEEIKAPVTQIGFASQKPEEPPKPDVTEPAARKIGFVSQKSDPQPKPPTAGFRPTSKIQHPTSAVQHPPFDNLTKLS